MRKEMEFARNRAEELLLKNGSDIGLLGSSEAYKQVWARESMICGLALLLIDWEEGKKVQRRSLETLKKYQSPLGKIPHNVGMAKEYDPTLVAYGGKFRESEKDGVFIDTAHEGCVDGNLWYIIGQYYYYIMTKDKDFLEESWDSLQKALLWLRYQDSNECGLLEVHEAMDWADLFANRYNVLLDNVLYVAAYKCMSYLAEVLGEDGSQYQKQAQDTHYKLNLLLWVGPEEPKDRTWLLTERKEWLYPINLTETLLVQRPYYLPYMAFRDYGDRFDTLGNLLAIILGVADEIKTNKILEYIKQVGLDAVYPIRALHPVINPGEKDWRDYYYLRNLNLPYQYHNGGIWPFIGGFYVVALVKAGRLEEAQKQLERLTELNKKGRKQEWEFNEWFHGQTGEPMGYAGQSWSTAMYIYAYECVKRGEVIVFNASQSW